MMDVVVTLLDLLDLRDFDFKLALDLGLFLHESW